MSAINLTQNEKDALASIDTTELDKAIDRAMDEERSGALLTFRLSSCGPYVSNKLNIFLRDLADHAQAKSSRKREETGDRLRRAGYNLVAAVIQMKQRMKEEEEDGQFFYVDDNIYHPFSFSNRLSVTVYYRWRKLMTDTWTSGSIRFDFDAKPRPTYGVPVPKRKPSVAKQEEMRQADLSDTWERLMRDALYSVRDYLKEGRDPTLIPNTFQARPDAHSGYLNNYSTQFWRDTP